MGNKQFIRISSNWQLGILFGLQSNRQSGIYLHWQFGCFRSRPLSNLQNPSKTKPRTPSKSITNRSKEFPTGPAPAADPFCTNDREPSSNTPKTHPKKNNKKWTFSAQDRFSTSKTLRKRGPGPFQNRSEIALILESPKLKNKQTLPHFSSFFDL